MHRLRSFAIAASAGLAALGLATVAPAAAATGGPPGPYVCTGGMIPAGDYGAVVVKGLCVGPPKGEVLVGGPVVVAPGATLAANYPAIAKGKPEGDATWLVAGTMTVGKGASLLLGCSPHFGCKATTNDTIAGGITATAALGVIVHSTTLGGPVSLMGGGGGTTCKPLGVFKLFGQPVYSDFEDDTVMGNLTVRGLASCWLGLGRDAVHGNVAVVNDLMADPDAIEIISNAVTGSLACSGNLKVWDSGEAAFGQKALYPRVAQPNAVLGARSGQCVLASPATQGGPLGPGAF